MGGRDRACPAKRERALVARRRQLNLKSRPAERRVFHRNPSPMGGRDLRDDGQSQSTSARVTVTRLVQTNESLEDPVSILLWDPLSVVVDVEDGGAVVLPKRQGDRAPAVPGCIVGEISEQLRELATVADHSPGRNAARVDLKLRRGAQTPRFLEDQIVEVHRLGL